MQKIDDPTDIRAACYGPTFPLAPSVNTTWIQAESIPWTCDPYRRFVAQKPGHCEACGELRWLDPHHLSPPEPRKTGQVAVDESVAGLRRVLDGLTVEDSGTFQRFDGGVIEW